MKVLVDTNIYVDLVQRREPNATESRELLRRCRASGVETYIAWHSISNIWYISRKLSGRDRALRALRMLLQTTSVPRCGTSEVLDAIGYGLNDFEDAMQVAVAEFCGADYIVTRNIGDFKKSPVRAMTPRELTALL